MFNFGDVVYRYDKRKETPGEILPKEEIKMKKEYDKNTILSEKMRYYEGADGTSKIPFYSTVSLAEMSDRQEAAMLLMYADAVFKTKSEPLASEIEKHDEIIARLEEIT